MSTYRIDGIKYNPANWVSLAPSERAACNRFAAARERELNTITTAEWVCVGGPFAGSKIEIESTTEHTAAMTVGAWCGRYELTGDPYKKDTPRRLEWKGNDAGAPVNTHGTSTTSKAAPEVTARGFDQLRDLLGDLAEDPAERATTTSEAGPTRPTARYTIGRTTYTVPATAASQQTDATDAKPEELATVDAPDHTDHASATPAAHTPQATADAVAQADTPAPEATTPANNDASDCTGALKTQAQATDYTDPLKTQNHSLRAEFFSAASQPGNTQRASSKTGAWSAVMFRTSGGRTALQFTGTDGVDQYSAHATGPDRMRALQAMARAAEQAAAYDQQEADKLRELARGFTPEQCEQVACNFERDNNHGAALIWRCMGAEAFDLAARAAAYTRALNKAGQLTPALSNQRAAIAADLRARISTDCTQPLKTREQAPDCTDPLKTPGAGALSIRLERYEGRIEECGRPVTVGSFSEADAVLMQWSDTAPATGGYDKCGYVVTWPNGDTYADRLDLVHHTRGKPSLGDDIASAAEFALGKRCPLHMSERAYMQHAANTSEENRAHCETVLGLLAQHAGYFPRLHPVHVPDMLALVDRLKITPDDLVGLGVVTYSPDDGRAHVGAITEAQEVSREWSDRRALMIVATYEDGTIRHMDADSFEDVRGDRFARHRLDMRRHGAPYLAQLAAARALNLANASAAKQRATEAHAALKIRLQAENPTLKTHAQAQAEGGKLRGCTLAAWNIRQLLKTAFPGVRFSVKTSQFSMGDSISIKWTDGPTDKAVSAIVDQFSGGRFDGMDDSYTYTASAWTELFGSSKYVQTSRDLSDAAVGAILAEIYPDEANRPTVEDHKNGRIRDDWNRNPVHLHSAEWTAPSAKA